MLELSKRRQIEGVNKGERLLVFGPELRGFALTREPRERERERRTMTVGEKDTKEKRK